MALQTLPLDAIPDKALSAWAGGDGATGLTP